jgi:hypothetical protein
MELVVVHAAGEVPGAEGEVEGSEGEGGGVVASKGGLDGSLEQDTRAKGNDKGVCGVPGRKEQHSIRVTWDP